jgi:hypothetical protein
MPKRARRVIAYLCADLYATNDCGYRRFSVFIVDVPTPEFGRLPLTIVMLALLTDQRQRAQAPAIRPEAACCCKYFKALVPSIGLLHQSSGRDRSLSRPGIISGQSLPCSGAMGSQSLAAAKEAGDCGVCK